MRSDSASELNAALFSREEILGGLPMRRARALLFLIERRTAWLAEGWREALRPAFLGDQPDAAAVLAATLLPARDPDGEPPDPLHADLLAAQRLPRPKLHELERFAAEWSDLVPPNPRQRAALAHLLAGRYQLTYRGIPGIRAALGLDDEAVQGAYGRLFDRPIESIYRPEVTLAERVRRLTTGFATRLQRLSPFWLTLTLVTTLCLPQALLALPIAAAGSGPIPAVVLALVVGGLNALTMAAIAESVVRAGAMRLGVAFVGRLGGEYLGPIGGAGLTLATAAAFGLALLVAFLGFANSLADVFGIPATLLVLGQAALLLYLLPRVKLSVVLVVALGLVNVGILFVLLAMLLPDLRSDLVFRIGLPPLGDAAALQVALRSLVAVTLMGFFAQAATPQIWRLVLPRDPGGRAFIRGCAMSSLVLTALLCGTVLLVDGAFEPAVLIGESGTMLGPIAIRLGADGAVLATLLLVLFLGLGALRCSTILGGLVQELLPNPQRATLLLPRRQGRIIVRAGGSHPNAPRVGMTFLGLELGQPRFALDVQVGGTLERGEVVVDKAWTRGDWHARFPALRRAGVGPAIEVLECDDDAVLLRITSPAAVTYEPGPDRLRVVELLDLADEDLALVQWVAREGTVGPEQVAAYLGQPQAGAIAMLEPLVQRGLLRRVGDGPDTRYRVRFAPRRPGRLPAGLYRRLDDSSAAVTDDGSRAAGSLAHRARQRLGELFSSPRGRSMLMAAPLLLTAAVAEALLLSNTGTFVGVLAIIGVVAIPLLAGTFPMLLLVASRRKGDLVPVDELRFLGHPVVVVGVFLFYLGTILLHGAFIWTTPIEKGVAFGVAGLVLGSTYLIWRRGGFAHRVVVELRVDPRAEGSATFALRSGGAPVPADVRLEYLDSERELHAADGTVEHFGSLRSATFGLPGSGARELKVWAHQVTPEGGSEALPALVRVREGSRVWQLDLGLAGGPVLLRPGGGPCEVTLTLPQLGSRAASRAASALS